MNYLVLLVTACSLTTALAKPGYHEIPLEGTPNLNSYDHLSYPKFELQELGSEVHGELPPKTIKISNTVTLKIPKPYPVKVPHNVPVPVPVAKPYPVEVTKFIKVPHPVPVEVIKHVHVPVEVPKPYPVSHEEYAGGQHGGVGGGEASLSGSSFGADFSGSYGGAGGGGGYEHGAQEETVRLQTTSTGTGLDHGQQFIAPALGIQGDQSGSYSGAAAAVNEEQHQPDSFAPLNDQGYESHE